MRSNYEKQDKFMNRLLIYLLICFIVGIGGAIFANGKKSSSSYSSSNSYNYRSNSSSSSYSNVSSYTNNSPKITTTNGITTIDRGISVPGSSQSIICPECGKQQFRRKNCRFCGYQILIYKTEYINCPYCNYENPAYQDICRKCKKALPDNK